ncbi:MAG: hypothetical protein ACHQEB_02265 [Chitinophagales bacterium]
MKGLENPAYLVLYVISNIAALVMWVAAWKSPRLGRLLFFLLFTWASWANWNEAIRSPQFYLDYADLSFLNIYKQIILGWFSKHITEAVGFIASCQALIAVSMLLKGWILKLGSIGAIIFLLAIAPFGAGSAFPCTIIMAFGMYVLIRNPSHDYLWINPKSKKAALR